MPSQPCFHTYTQTTLQLALALPYLLIICYVSGDALARLTVSNSRVEMLGWLSIPQRTYRGRLEIRGVYLPLSGGRDGNMVKGVGLHPPPTSLGWFLHHDGMYARKWPLSFSILCGLSIAFFVLSTVVGGRFQNQYGCHFPFFSISLFDQIFMDFIKHNIAHI
jgi:hypothetical protein